MSGKYLTRLIESKYFFYSVLLLNILFLFSSRFYPSMDGPAHLYNSNVLLQLLKGNHVLGEYYSTNSLPIPNWTGHVILLVFHVFLSAWMAEKMLLLIYVAGMAMSFRYLIKELNPENVSLSILIFPFIYSFLFHLGFYNFSLSFILFFMTLGFWLRNYNSNSLSKYLILFLLITTTYFTNLLIFGFLGLTIGLFIVYFSYERYLIDKNLKDAILFAGRRLLILFIISLPSLAFLLIFFLNTQFHPAGNAYPVKELIKWINDARPFIVYNYPKEEIYTQQYFHVLVLLLAFSFILRDVTTKKEKIRKYKKINVLLIPVLISLVLFFIVPDGSSAGMMSDRYCLILYILGLLWIVSRGVYTKLNGIIILTILAISFGLLFKHRKVIKNLDSKAVEISQTAKYIDKNSVVLPVNLSDNWLEPHFSDYLGVNKPMILLENYEANVGWFPVKWDWKTLPDVMLNGNHSVSGLHWVSNVKSQIKKQIDYILIYGNLAKLNDPKWKELKEQLSAGFKLIYKPNNNYILLYKKRLKNLKQNSASYPQH